MTLSMGAEPRDRPCPIPYGNSTNSELTGSAESLSAAAAHCTYSTGIVMSPCTKIGVTKQGFTGFRHWEQPPPVWANCPSRPSQLHPADQAEAAMEWTWTPKAG